MMEMIDRNKALRAVDLVASLMENCSDHNNGVSQLLEKLSEFKACTELLKTLTSYQNAERVASDAKKNSFLPELQDMIKLDKNELEVQNLNRECNTSKSLITVKNLPLTIQDEQNLATLGMEAPGKLSKLQIFLRSLEERKINLLKVLIEFLPCGSCHRQALVDFSPDKYSFLANENVSADIDYDTFLSERKLPFEFSDDDRLGPWDVLLSEDAVKDMRSLESPQMIKAVMKKFGHISSGKWDQYELRNKIVDCSSVDVYEMELPDQKGLRILWQVVKIWTVTANQEQIREMLENLVIVHQVYTIKQIQLCKTDKNKDGVILPKIFKGLMSNSTNERLYDHQDDDERLIKKKMSFTQFYEYIKKKEEENINSSQSNNALLEEDDEMRILGDIPNSFRQLTDDHFPLFITYEKFSQMLEGTYVIDVNKLWKTKQEFNTKNFYEDEEYKPTSSFVDTSEKSWAHFITFELFVKKYWNKFGYYYRNKLDPALVYAEFSIIKGSNPEVECLSREEYLAVTTKKYPIFYNREEIYNLFERYEKMKKLNYDYDSIDRSLKAERFALNVNYRSHNGILGLAASVIDLIQYFFPNSIDKLPRERGEGYQDEASVFKCFTVVGKSGDAIEFGANQVIIVRDEKAKKRLEESIGKVGLILTIFEAKGMEFNDVLLYDFFTDSPAGQKVARDSIHDFDNDTIRSNFIKAAKSFKECSRPIQAASCYQDIEMYKEAGDIYYESNIFESAADCYFKCEEWGKAGECYKKANKYAEAVTAYKNGGYYDIVIDLMQSYRQKIDDKTLRRISRFVNIHYRREDNKEMCEKAFHIIPTQEERIEFLEDHAPEELLKIYVKKKQFHDAGEFLRSRGNFEKAALIVLGRQRYWAEKLVDHLFRYQSPHTSCAEISYIVIHNHLNDMRNDLFNLVHKVWLKDGFKSGKDFGVMLKCMSVLQQLRHKWGFNKFRWVVNKRFEVKKPPLIGFEYDQKRRCDVS
ncbi:1529_t:CDS:10, partial [Racocetra fulgida]